MYIDEELDENKVRTDEWSEMSMDDLYDQKNILVSRLNSVTSYPNPIISEFLNNGIFILDQHISNRLNNTNDKKNRTLII